MSAILSRKTLSEVSCQLKQNDRKVVFTHGSFDLLHIGHIELLRRSKKKGDYLIVGVDDDALVRTYKEPSRPIIPHNDRMRILMELGFVDFVMPIECPEFRTNDYYMEMYSDLSPDCVTFGRDFSFINEMKLCKRDLPKTKFKKIAHRYNKQRSTSNIIESIRLQ